MKTLNQVREEFMKQAREYDLGRKEEDFHSYLRTHNLEHHLSETQIRNRNMESNKLNSLGMVMGIGVPLTLGSIFGLQKLTSNIIGHGSHNFREPLVRDIDTLTNRVYEIPTDRTTSLSGFNTRPMPTAPHHIGQSTENTLGVIGNMRNRNIGLMPPTMD
mgnify:FL=1|tara:strand:+ start:545 stop:1024 length:480 start_codon:yes stop_codon:yes gene_type:complete